MTACRVCGSAAIVHAGDVEYLEGFRAGVYDCASCGCRFTPHDPDVHDQFHREPSISYYQDYAALAAQCATLFNAGDAAGLRRLLSQSAKYRFVLEHLDRAPAGAKLLEIGCARGHLTSYSILQQRDVLGVDVSKEAIAAARAMFGPHFAVADTREAQRGPFDVIYHVGLIGCVADPIGLTRRLLSELRHGGQLIFNAPNRNALRLKGQLWLDSAPPPDLVTLFPENFWRTQFGDVADVSEAIDDIDPQASLQIAARRWLGVRWRPPVPQPLTVRGFEWIQSSGGMRRSAARVLAGIAARLGLAGVAGARPAEFGIFVRMAKTA